MEINKNSFDIISLIAAVDVMVAHTVAHSSPGGELIFCFGDLWLLHQQLRLCSRFPDFW